jgi:type IV secretion system protein VirB11
MNARALPLHVLDTAPGTQQSCKLDDSAATELPQPRGGAALRTHLKPLQPWLDAAGVTEISVNRAREIWIARQGEQYMERHAVEELTQEVLLELARQIATSTEQEVGKEKPLLSAELPNGYRIQLVLPPAAGREVVLSIRKPAVLDLSLADYEGTGAFDLTNRIGSDEEEGERALRAAYAKREFGNFLRLAIRTRKNILISAGTDTGKTTLLNAMLKEISPHERLVVIEDARELRPAQSNAVRLFYSRGDQGLARVSAQDLCEATLRLRPDRILLGELRGKEAFTYLRTINSGHPGSITTIHSDSPRLAFEQLALMVMQGFPNIDKTLVIEYVRSIIPIVIQGRRAAGRRYISEIYYADADRPVPSS